MPENTRTTRRRRTLWHRTLAAGVVLAATGSILAAAPQPAQAALPAQSIADPVHYWNDVLQNVFRRVGGGPVPMARAAAMMNAAIYDAESSYQLKWKGKITSEPYIKAENYVGWAEGPDEEERVIGRTAYNILLGLYGNKQSRYADQTQYLDARFRERFGTEPTAGDFLDLSVVAGMVKQMTDARTGDGSDNPQVYAGDNKPGAWRPTSYPDMPDASCDEDSDAVNPYWGQVKPFSLTSGSQFRPTTLTAYGTYENLVASDEYKRQVEAVRTAGADKPTAATPVVNRTPDQLAAAWFWANDNNGTYKPPGHMLQATREVAKARGLGVYAKTRHFTSFSAAAKEDADSRIWLGVHYPWDATDGLTLGDKVANQVFTTKLRTL